MLTLKVIKEPVNQSWSIEKIAKETPPITWEHVFNDAKHELHDISVILDEQEKLYGQYYPLKRDIFAAFNYTPLNNIKLVIVGQDPYHQTINIDGVNVPRAVGLSFSVRSRDTIPSSLQNIYKELSNTVRGFVMPGHGDLREWARQGVLMLNMCLTVKPNKPGSHGDIWLGFINKVFKAISVANPYCIFMLWGREAQKVKPMLGERSVIFEAAHPSGFSAKYGFFNKNLFNLANEALKKQGKIGINWSLSTLAELSSPASHIISPTPSTNHQSHQPILTPINVELLPTIIPHKPSPTPVVGTNVPQYKSLMLPTIPNTKQNYPTIIPTKPASPQEKIISLNIGNTPIIPQIVFDNETVTTQCNSNSSQQNQDSQSTNLPKFPTLVF